MVNSEYLLAFKNRRVMVTGHTGFKGAWLVFLLKELGADVLGYALGPVGEKNLFESLGIEHSIHHVEADIRDVQKLKSTMNSFQPEFVFHLAAQALVRISYANPIETFDVNVMGSINLLDTVYGCKSVRSLVFITSDKCYENVEWVWGYRENDRLGGHDPYSASKAAAEIAFSAYARSFFFKRPELGAVAVRAGNVIGGGDWAPDRIVPDCVRAIQTGKAISLRNPNATRPWQHVLEPLSGYLLLATRLQKDPAVYSGAWNFGPFSSGGYTVLEVAEYIVKYFGYGAIVTEDNMRKCHEAQLLQLNCDKANKLLGWYPRWDVHKTLISTAKWYKTIIEGGDAKSITREQIQDYFTELL